MRVETIATSSPSTISAHSDDDEIDQLVDMFPSSPDTEISCTMNLTCDVEMSKLGMALQIYASLPCADARLFFFS